FGDHTGHSPRASELARNCTCGKNCDLASHGIVTLPESHGQAGPRQASPNIAIAGTSGPRAVEPTTRARHPRHEVAPFFISARARAFGQRDVWSSAAGTGATLFSSIRASGSSGFAQHNRRRAPTGRDDVAPQAERTVDHDGAEPYHGARTKERLSYDDHPHAAARALRFFRDRRPAAAHTPGR